ncbi:MAG: hypothetical protein R6V19_15615, partial [Armatimonadota bacterium]
HIPVDKFGPSSASWTKKEPTPSVETEHNGLQKVSITLREGPGPILDRFVFKNEEGEVVAEVEAENAPPLPEEDIEQAPDRCFYVKNDGHAANVLTGRVNHVGLHITYLRNRFGGEMAAGDTASMHNIFYNDKSDAPKEYDIRRIGDEETVILQDGTPVAVCGSGDEIDMEMAPDAAMAMVTRETYILAGVTVLDGLFSANGPVAVEIDLQENTARVSGPADVGVRDPTGAPLATDAGEIVIDCSEWEYLAEVKESVARFFDNTDDLIQEPTAAETAREELPVMDTQWATEVPLEEGEGELAVGVLHPADLDADGADELIVLRGRTAHCLDTSGDILWSFPTGGVCRAAETYDLDGDGIMEVLIGSGDEHVYVLNTDGEEITSHHCDVPLRVGTSSVRDPKVSNIVVDDLEADGALDIIVGTLNGNLIRYDTDFDLKWRYDGIPHGTRELTVLDLDGDGVKEILAANKYGHVQIFDAEGNRKPGTYSELGDVEMAVGNLDDDDAYEIANGSFTGTFTCREYSGEQAFTFHNYGFAVKELLMDDVTGNGVDELLVGSETGYAYILDGAGDVKAQRDFGAIVTDLTTARFQPDMPSIVVGCADGRAYLTTASLELQQMFKADSEVVLLDTLTDGEGVKLLVATADTVHCVAPVQ